MNDDQFERVWRNLCGGYGSVPGHPDIPGATVEELRDRTGHTDECPCWRHRIVAILDIRAFEEGMMGGVDDGGRR